MVDEKILVFIPTYNEQENVEKLYNEIMNLGLDVDVLFIDDNSPDGTGKILEDMVKKNPNIFVVHRAGKLGIGSAHLEGIDWAYAHQYKTLITMDSDFTHPPRYIPDFIRSSKNQDIVVGSRYLNDRGIEGWSLIRGSLTRIGHALTRYLLRMKYDATGAFRLYCLDKIPKKVFRLIHANDYSFFFESLYVLHVNTFSIKEIPISLPPRTLGHSKITLHQILQWGTYLFYLFLLTIFNKKRFVVSERKIQTYTVDTITSWDKYWTKKDKTGHIYDFIAEFYRRHIIKRNLNRFIKKYFSNGSKALHAGCGSGEVDTDISKKIDIISLDLSAFALSLNKTIDNTSKPLIRGTIFDLPFPNSTFDGVYNLGVMEHFTGDEISLILQELKRVIKPDGKIILFWPPEFGSSVMFLKVVHFILNRVFSRNIKLHPDEISRIKSRRHIKTTMKKAGFKIVEQSFSIRDLFTYYVVICEKPSEEPGGNMGYIDE